MEFKYYLPTKIISGRNCLTENKQELLKYGKRAFIVTGKRSGKASGALDDLDKLLRENGIEYAVFDRVENNPTLENVKEGGQAACSFGADFVIGLGGGSPLDAAKAIAVLAVNAIDPVDLYKNSFEVQPLPIIAIPTTSGTGSEVTPYSILTRNDIQTKMSFGNDSTFPKVAFLDARYTESMNYRVTVNTAVDAFSHSVEGYLGKRSSPVSDIYAEEGIRIFGRCLDALIRNRIDSDIREKLLYASALGGMVITHTGTTIVHGMGYSLTYFKDIPHGMANGFLMGEYFRFNYEYGRQKIDRILELLNCADIGAFQAAMKQLLGESIRLTEDEMQLYSSLAMKQRSTSFNIRPVQQEDMVEIYRRSMGTI